MFKKKRLLKVLLFILFMFLFVFIRPRAIKADWICGYWNPFLEYETWFRASSYCANLSSLICVESGGSCEYEACYSQEGTCYQSFYYGDPPIPFGTMACYPRPEILPYCKMTGTPCGSCTPSCTPGPCSGCTPTCPVGQSTEVSGELCKHDKSSCTGTNGCNSCILEGGYCYDPETNITPPTPASITITVDGVPYPLSTNPNSPTKIKLPSTNPTVTLTTPWSFTPPTARELGYAFSADNYGVGDEWNGGAECTGVAGEDFCIEDTTNTQDFDPATKTVLEVLKENAEGEISAQYYTLNVCDFDKEYSEKRTGYYIVDRIPDPEDGDNDPPTKSSTLPEFMTDITTEGCSSSTYTGKEINNPLHVNIIANDPDSNDEIEAGIIWFSKDESVPNLVDITSNDTLSNTNDFGIMIRKNGTWSNPLIYITNETNEWKLLTEADKLSLTDTSVVQGIDVVFDFKIVFEETPNNPFGMYNLYVGAIDTYMINDNVVDQSRLTDVTNWGIDLSDPSVGDITQSIQDIQNILISWNVTDLESDVEDIVINGYRSGGVATSLIELFSPPPPYNTSEGSFMPLPVPPDDQIGILSDLSSAWHFTNNTMSRTETDKLNVGDNEGGNINIYVTAYDQGCNTSGTYENIDLNPWVTSYGGTIYSNGGILNPARDVSEVEDLIGVFENITRDNLDTGTETISSRASTISSLVKNLGVTAPNVYDANDRKSYWYDHFVEKLHEEKSENAVRISSLSDITDPEHACSSSSICYMETDEELNFPTGFICSKKLLFISSADINLQPDIQNSNSQTGCIFFTKGDIHIGAGGYKSAATSNVQYDYIEGYLIAQGQITFDLVDLGTDLRDGIEIRGGMVAFGENVSGSSAINIQRNLKLFSQTNPTVVLTYDSRYPNISSQFFGTEAPIYKQEVGFKTF
ncbi:MAG: hypothetical protein PHE21_00745 [Candidatus Dojkabacteria bacterium]|nr:hypothetical protein [Candidatus Dojkabacteria bacterium]